VARLYFTGGELGDFSEVASISDAPTVQNTTKRTGTYAFELTSAAANKSVVFVESGGVLSHTTVYGRVYFRLNVATPPSVAVSPSGRILFFDTAGATVARISTAWNTDGTVTGSLRHDTLGQIGSDFTLPADGAFHLCELKCVMSATVGILEAKIDGVVVASGTGLNTGTASIVRAACFGPPNTNGLAATLWLDDLLLDDSAYPGAGQSILRLAKSGTPTYDAFTKTGGAAINTVWDDLPFSATDEAHSTSASQAQTALADDVGAGTDPIASGDTINACKVAMIAKTLAPAAIEFVNSALGGTSTTTSFSITLPATQSGDILILEFAHRGTGNGTIGGTYSGGAFALKHSQLFASSTFSGKTYWSRATGNHSGQTVTGSGLTNSCAAIITIYRNCLASGDPLADATIVGEQNASGDETQAEITTTTNGAWVVLVVANSPDVNVGSQSCTSPGVLQERAEVQSTGGTDSSISHASELKATAGATGSFTYSISPNAASGSWAYAISPAAATPGTYKIRRRVNSSDTDTTKTLTSTDAYYDDGVWTATLAQLQAMEMGALRDSGGVLNMQVEDVYVLVDYTPAAPTGHPAIRRFSQTKYNRPVEVGRSNVMVA
jgi:hypothetical protein